MPFPRYLRTLNNLSSQTWGDFSASSSVSYITTLDIVGWLAESFILTESESAAVPIEAGEQGRSSLAEAAGSIPRNGPLCLSSEQD